MIPEKFRKSNGYVIYVHQSPSNKVYIGKTKQKPINRWGYNGVNYFYNRNTKFSKNDNSILEFYSIGKAAEYLHLSVSGLKDMISKQRFENEKVRGMKIDYKRSE